MLDRLRQVFEESLRGSEPALRDRIRGATLVIPGESQREPCSARLVTRRRESRIRALALLDRVVELPAPPGGIAEALEVLRRQVLPVDARVRLVGLTPREARDGPASGIEGIDDLRHVFHCHTGPR